MAAAIALFGLNAFIAARLFSISIFGGLYSIESSYISLAKERSAQGNFFPLWYCGMPWPNTYPPMLQAIVSFFSRNWFHDIGLAYHNVTGVFYCLVPVAIFVLVRVLTKRYVPAVLAGLAVSTISPATLLFPGAYGELLSYFRPRRLQVMIEWGEGPHVSSIFWMILAMAAVVTALRVRKPWAYSIAALVSACALLTNWLGGAALGITVLVYLCAMRCNLRDWLAAVGIGIATYGFAIAWIPLSTVQTIRKNSDYVGGSYTMGWKQYLGFLAMAVSVWLLDRLLERWKVQAATRFLLLTGAVFGVISTSAFWLQGFYFLPQPGRYHLEMELFLLAGLVLLFEGIPIRDVHLIAGGALVILAGSGISEGLAYSNQILHASTVERTTEYKVARWFEDNHPGVRVFCPGTIGFWLNVFTQQPQLGGGFEQGSTNSLLPGVMYQIMVGEGKQMAAVSNTWLEAFGTGYVCITNEKSEEYYKPFHDKKKFDDVLPVVYRTTGEVIYQVNPTRSALAVHASAKTIRDMKWTGTVFPQTTDAMLSTIPADRPVQSEWQGDRLILNANPQPGEAISVRLTALPGWSASVNGVALPLQTDALGLMYMEPQQPGPQRIELTYARTWEYRISQLITALTALCSIAWMFFHWIRLRTRW